MPSIPEKILVFSSESDDLIGLQIYRLLYKNSSYDVFFVDGDYNRTEEVTNYVFPSLTGEDEFLNAEQLVEFFGQVENITLHEYHSLGLFYDFDLGFEFTEEMIAEISEGIETQSLVEPIAKTLSGLSYVTQNWDLINWETSKDRLIENFNFLIKSEDDLGKIEEIINETAEFHDLVYPELFEMLTYESEMYEKDHIYAKSKTKLFCLKTNAEGKLTHLMYDLVEVEDVLDEIKSKQIFDIDATLLSTWYAEFSDPFYKEVPPES